MTISETLLPLPKVRDRVGGISRTTIWHWVRAGQFPQPVKVGTKRIMWRESDLQRWIDAQSSAAEQQVAA